MNIKEYLVKTLNVKEILDLTTDNTVHFLHANKARETYVEYEILDEYGSDYSEGQERYTHYLVQIDIFSKTNYSKLEKAIKKAMKKADFTRGMACDLYEEKTKLFHKGMRFNIDLPAED